MASVEGGQPQFGAERVPLQETVVAGWGEERAGETVPVLCELGARQAGS